MVKVGINCIHIVASDRMERSSLEMRCSAGVPPEFEISDAYLPHQHTRDYAGTDL